MDLSIGISWNNWMTTDRRSSIWSVEMAWNSCAIERWQVGFAQMIFNRRSRTMKLKGIRYVRNKVWELPFYERGHSGTFLDRIGRVIVARSFPQIIIWSSVAEVGSSSWLWRLLEKGNSTIVICFYGISLQCRDSITRVLSPLRLMIMRRMGLPDTWRSVEEEEEDDGQDDLAWLAIDSWPLNIPFSIHFRNGFLTAINSSQESLFLPKRAKISWIKEHEYFIITPSPAGGYQGGGDRCESVAHCSLIN